MDQPLPEIVLYDTMSGAKQPLETVEPGVVRMYVCGLTVYDYSHIGHARTFILFDMIRRYLDHRGYDVRFVRNHTDVDDRIITRANEVGEDPGELAQRFVEAFDEDMQRLGCLPPDVSPRVTTEIEAIINMIGRLVERGHAYAVDGDVLFEVATFPGYGKLSKKVLSELRAGERVEVDTRKRHPADFALWKAAKPNEPKWESPWGEGRPGWHIECSAMSTKYLGDSFDIHGGGRDLVFPHHENEIAQSEGATGVPFVRYWMHAGPLMVGVDKMSKSLGNFWTVRDALEAYHPEVIRFFMLTAHYRKSISFNEDALEEARGRVVYFCKTLDRIQRLIELSAESTSERTLHESQLSGYWSAVHAAMDDDFNTPKFLALLSDLAKLANEIMPKKLATVKDPALLATLSRVAGLLSDSSATVGLFSRPAGVILKEIRDLRVGQLGLDSADIERLIAQRADARAAKDWSRADALRDELEGLGVTLMDSALGTGWEVA